MHPVVCDMNVFAMALWKKFMFKNLERRKQLNLFWHLASRLKIQQSNILPFNSITVKLTPRRSRPAASRFGTTIARSWNENSI